MQPNTNVYLLFNTNVFCLLIRIWVIQTMLLLKYLQTHWKNQGNRFYHTCFCRSIFVHSIQQPVIPDNAYCWKVTITHADNVRAFNVTKIIRWMITSLNNHVILMLSWIGKCFLSWKDTTIPSYSLQLIVLEALH